MKLGLGTAQFGLDYGVSNTGGKTPLNEIRCILDLAWSMGVRVLDTAALYGDSEEALGQAMSPDSHFDIVTKTPHFNRNITDREVTALETAFARSLELLRRPSVYGLLVHNADDLLKDGGDALYRCMQGLKERKLVGRIGASVYDASQIDGLLARYSLDLVQLPINVLDQRLIASGHLSRLKDKGIEVHARSVFLQGLLLMSADTLPPHFDGVRPHLEAYHSFVSARGFDPVSAALAFVASLPEIDTVLCGVNNAQHLREIGARFATAADAHEFRRFAITDPMILNPSNWRH